MVKGAIFDLDGTLVHSLPDLRDCMNAMLRKFGYPEITEAETMRNIGRGAREFVLQSLPAEARGREEECRRAYAEIYAASGSPKTALFPGIPELLTRLSSAGVKLAVVSNKPQRNTEQVYEKYLSAYAFDYVTGHRPGTEIKPDPASTFACLAALGLEPGETAFIGDGETDAQAALRSGTLGISVLWGYRTREELAAAGATRFARTPAELFDILNSL